LASRAQNCAWRIAFLCADGSWIWR
jgi:hypothetical protein